MANTYVLVNPHINGSVETKIKADNSLQAAKKAYKNVSKHFNNNIPKFYFTLQIYMQQHIMIMNFFYFFLEMYTLIYFGLGKYY